MQQAVMPEDMQAFSCAKWHCHFGKKLGSATELKLGSATEHGEEEFACGGRLRPRLVVKEE